jgi:hypothetical protein
MRIWSARNGACSICRSQLLFLIIFGTSPYKGLWFGEQFACRPCNHLFPFRVQTHHCSKGALRATVWLLSRQVKPAFVRGALMVSHCANPACSVQFHSLKLGRLYRFEITSPQPHSADVPEVPKSICKVAPTRRTVYFWLCRQCSSTFSLSLNSRHEVLLKPSKRFHHEEPVEPDIREGPSLDPASAFDPPALEHATESQQVMGC